MAKFSFAGTQIVAPGFILRSVIGVQRVLQLLPFGKILMVGASDGGLGGGTIYEFNDMNTAKRILRGGPLYKALAAAARVGGASGFVAVVAGAKAKATATINGTAPTAGVLTADAGTWGNNIKYQITVPGTTSGFMFTLQYPDAYGNTVVVGGANSRYDNLADLQALAAVIAADTLLTPPTSTGYPPIVTFTVTQNGVPTATSLTALTGGSGDGSAALAYADYKAGIDAVVDEPFDLGHLVGAYDSQSQAYADGQADQVAPLGYLHRWFHQVQATGASAAQDKQQNSLAVVNAAVTRAQALNEKRAAVTAQQFKILDPDTGLDVWMDAAPIMCGYFALIGGTGDNGPATAATMDIIPTVKDVDYTVLRTTGDADNAILGGAMVFERLKSGVRCIQSVTTAPNDANGNPWIYAEISVTRVVDAVAANIKGALESPPGGKILGGGNDSKTAGHALSIVRDILEDTVGARWTTGFNPSAIGIAPANNGTPNDDIVSWDMAPVFPLNHLGLDQTVQPFSVTVSQQTGNG